MSMDLWRNTFILRRFGPQKYRKGYVSKNHTEMKVDLDIQESVGRSTISADGSRHAKNLKTIGKSALRPVDQITGTPADRLFYKGAWYECRSCIGKTHISPIAHYVSEFEIVSEGVNPTNDSTPATNAEGGV